MRVLLAAVSASPHPDGVTRHAANLGQALLLNPDIERIDLVAGDWQRQAFTALLRARNVRLVLSTAQSEKTALSRNRWYWSRLPELAAALDSTIVHVAYPVPINKRAFSCPTVVTLHDLYPYDIPANFGYPHVLANRAILQQCLHAIDSIVCVSDSTMHRLEVHLPPAIVMKARTIHNSLNAGPAVATKSPFGAWRDEPFLLCVGQHRRNKNLPLAVHLLRRLLDSADLPQNARLLIVGAEGPETSTIKRLIRRAGLEANILLLQGVSDETLNWYYGHCEMLIAPSTIEGFGLPIIEAMHHRCRVLCSDIPAFREVGGAYCDYVPLVPDPVSAFAEAARAAFKDKKFRAAPTARFSAARAGEAHFNLYNGLFQACEHASPRGHGNATPALERGRP